MTEISSATIKQLRDMTGAGMMDCKKALTETAGNMDDAVDWLRKKGLAAAAKKSGRVAAEGLVAAMTDGTRGAAIELNAETDFVARNEQFQNLVKQVSTLALTNGKDLEALKQAKISETGRSVEEEITSTIAVIGENMNLRRSKVLSVNKGVVSSYVHNTVQPGMGKIAVLVALESEGKKDVLEALGKQLAMHAAAARPEALTIAEVSADAVNRERAVFKEQAMASGKPAEIADKMVEGRIRKYYEEVVLNEQIFVMDNKTKIADVVKNAEKDAGAPVKLAGFLRFQLGEGIEKEESDFAAEVAKAAAGA